MRASVLSRMALLLAALGVAIFGRGATALLSLAAVAGLYLLVGQGAILVRHVRILAVMLIMSGALWSFVYLDFVHPDPLDAITRLARPGAPFLLLLRMAVASILAVLALGSVADGEHLALARACRLGDNAAITLAGARALIVAVRTGFERALVTMKAHGEIVPGFGGTLRALPSILGLTWTASLDLAISRAELTWRENHFLEPGAPALRLPLAVSRRDSVACLGCALLVLAIIAVPLR